jgi:hypothetical protein
MADFKRGIKAGIIAVIVYLVVSLIIGEIYRNLLSIELPTHVAGLTPFLLTDLTDPSFVTWLLLEYIFRGILFGAVFTALYHYLPSVNSIVKGVVLSLFFCIVALIQVIYMNPGWPRVGLTVFTMSYYSGAIEVSSSISTVWPGIISALAFGALTGFLWDRFRGKGRIEARKGNSVLLVSFILGGVLWAVFAVTFIMYVIIRGDPAIDTRFLWESILFASVVFLGLPGWILALVAWRKMKRGESGFKWGVAGGVMMALTGFMLLPGVLAITGGVLSRRKPASQFTTAAIAQQP